MHSVVSRIFLARTLIATCPVVFVVHARVFVFDYTVWLFGAHVMHQVPIRTHP